LPQRADLEEAVVEGRLGLVLVGLFSISSNVVGKAAEQDRRTGFTVAVCNQSAVGPEVLAAARQQTMRIFDSAGMNVTWVELDRRSKCSIPRSPERYFIIIILSKAPAGWSSSDAMGMAPARGGLYPRAYVFYNSVQTTVDQVQDKNLRTEGLGMLLGHAIAHELGHLLIPGDAHSIRGIMTGAWTYTHWEEMAAGRLLFDNEQAKAIRRRLDGQ
jgi:hypothetical protein